MHGVRRMMVLGTAVLLAPAAAWTARQQQQPAPPPPSGQEHTPPAQRGSSSKKPAKKRGHADDFLIHGTVFQPSGLSFPGASLRIRRAGEKKFRWETTTNSRGEFAVRVPQGAEYELSVQAKGFEEAARSIDAKAGTREESVALHMKPAAGEKR